MIWLALGVAWVAIKFVLMATGALIWAIAIACILSKKDPWPPGYHSRNPEWDK